MALTRANIEARLKPYFPGEQGKQLVAILHDIQSDVTTTNANFNSIKTWADALVAKINADAVDNNAKTAFPLTLDTNYTSVSVTSIAPTGI